MPSSVCHVNLARITHLRGGAKQTELLIRELAGVVPRQRLVVLKREALADRLDDIIGLEVHKVRDRLSALRFLRDGGLLHAHEAHAAQVSYLAYSLWGNRYIITRRTDRPIGHSWFTQKIYRNAGTVVAISTAIEDQVRKRFGALPIVCIPSAWTSGEPSASAHKAIRERYAKKFLVGHIAAMDCEGKGHRILLQAASKLQNQAPEIHFLLLGAGQLEHEFRSQARGLENVSFVGWQEDPLSWISTFNLFVFPSLHEGLGSILLDVLRVGVPVVASRTGGIPDVITGDSGILVEPNSADSLVHGILSLYHSPASRESLSHGARAKAVEFSPQKMAGRYINLYKALGAF